MQGTAPRKLTLLFVLTFLVSFAAYATPATAQLVPEANLQISKSHEGNFTAGGNGVYTITVENVGGAATTSTFTVTDTLPDGLTHVSSNGPGFDCSVALQVVTCDHDAALGVGDTAEIELTVAVAVDAAALLTNFAGVSGGGGSVTERPVPDDTVIVQPGLEVKKSVDLKSVRVGKNLTYTIDVSNMGSTTVEGARVRDDLANILEVVSITPGDPTCTGTKTITCDLGDLAPSETRQIVIVVKTIGTGELTNEAFAYGGDVDEVGSGEVATSVLPRPHLEIEKVAANSVSTDAVLEYTIIARNLGPGEATNVVITDDLPAGLELTRVTPDAVVDMTCNLQAPPTITNPQAVVCTIPVLAEEQGAVLRLRVRVRPEGAINNTACLVHDDTDPAAKDLCATAQTISDEPGFNPPNPSEEEPEDPAPGSDLGGSVGGIVGGNAPPTPTPTPTATPVATAVPSPVAAGDPPPSIVAGARSITPPVTGDAGLR